MDKILRELLNKISDIYDKTPGYIIYDLLKAVSEILVKYNLQFEDLRSLLDINNLTGSLLETFVSQRKGITRNPSTYSVGQLVVNGNGIVEQGDLFETKGGIQFHATETKTISGTGTINIKAVVAGSSGNVPANQITQMPVTIAGIISVTNPKPTYDGFDEESDDSLRERYLKAVREPATSGNIYHYRQWALEVAGVGDVKIFPLIRGQNTAELYIIDQNKQPASSTLVDAVQEYIDPNSEGLGDGQAPIGCYCYVMSATGLPINISVNITKDVGYTDEQIKQNIEDNLTEYLKSIAFKQSFVSYAAITNVIFESNGVSDLSNLIINGGVDNVPVDGKEVAVLGDVNIVT